MKRASLRNRSVSSSGTGKSEVFLLLHPQPSLLDSDGLAYVGLDGRRLRHDVLHAGELHHPPGLHLTELHQLNPLVPDPRSLYKRIPYSLTVTGTYEQTGTFLYAIETGPRLANITSVSFRRSEPGSPALNLEVNLELLGKK